ncbi:MAG: hypothetical protein ACE366_20500 [Bradymonadia bacterium]
MSINQSAPEIEHMDDVDTLVGAEAVASDGIDTAVGLPAVSVEAEQSERGDDEFDIDRTELMDLSEVEALRAMWLAEAEQRQNG